MATILLQAAGAFLGGALGPIGSTVGAAIGATAGYWLDRQLIDSTRHIEGARLSGMKPFQAEEGAAVPRLYGTARLGGTMIWATRFEEDRTTRRQGFKGGPRVTTYGYFANVAFALCEGEIACVRRVWADGRELDLGTVEMRVYPGSQDQLPDPLIEAKQGPGNAPAYRGIAYAVFERLPLESYGNRVPQFQFEVMRPVGRFRHDIRAVALIPGATEYGLSPAPVTRQIRDGEVEIANRHVLHGPSDFSASIDELQALCPNLRHVALVVAWYGSDLRAGDCTVRPGVTDAVGTGYSTPWSVAGLDRPEAHLVSRVDGAAAYGGTPTDASVIEAIADLKARGLRVTLYPFLMMDVPAGNGLPDPYGALEQAAYPWRGRITGSVAPALPGTTDRTAAVTAEIAEFLGNTEAPQPVSLAGAPDHSTAANAWGYRRMILHYAQIAAQAGGVDTFLIGSELRGLTTLRDEADAFPFVHALRQLAGEVKAILGAETAVTYGADWSEYFGYQPADGSGDVYFHLDPLWADAAIDAVAIDNYMPLADWRDDDWTGIGADMATSPHDGAGLAAAIAGGEGFDWFYPDENAREAAARSPITDGAHAKPWVFRPKDILGWWQNQHIERRAGAELATPTQWIPQGKPVWFTEIGCPAAEKGANRPNVFLDAKSAENALPWFSNGGRDDLIQRRFLAAHFAHWNSGTPDFDAAGNPQSTIFGGRMVDFDRIYCWAWDARAFPAFPQSDTWKDGVNWARGHWLNGRISSVELGDAINAILIDSGLPPADAVRVDAIVEGVVIDNPSTARDALSPLIELYGISVSEEGGTLNFQSSNRVSEIRKIADRVEDREAGSLVNERLAAHELPGEAVLAFRDPCRNYQPATARHVDPSRRSQVQQVFAFPGVLNEGEAAARLSDWLDDVRARRSEIGFSLPGGSDVSRVGELIQLPELPGDNYIVTQVDLGVIARIQARRVLRRPPTPNRYDVEQTETAGQPGVSSPAATFLDLPLFADAEPREQLRIAAWAKPWSMQDVSASPEGVGFTRRTLLGEPATMGTLQEALPAGRGTVVETAHALVVHIGDGALESVTKLQLLNGANAAAVLADNSVWEIIQFATAEETAPDTWRLEGLLRGRLGTEDAMAAGASAGAPFVLLDEAVVPAGLREQEIGLMLNWRVAPAKRAGDPATRFEAGLAGGVRALTPLSPVHLRAARQDNGDIRFTWIRRSRKDADNWLATEIPLGEETERYGVRVSDTDGAPISEAESVSPQWTWPAAEVAAAFGSQAPVFDLDVFQISAAVGAGIAASRRFTFA